MRGLGNRQKGGKRWMKLPTLVSIMSLVMVLLLLGMVVMLAMTANELSKSVKESLVVTLVLQDDVAVEDAQALGDSLNQQPYLKHLEYISSEQALEEQTQSMGLDPSEFLGDNPFPISLELTMKHQYNCVDSLQIIAPQLKEHEAVHDVIYQHELVDLLNKNIRKGFVLLLGVSVILTLISMSLINNMVKIHIFNHRFDIYTMKLVGATWTFIRRPFMKRAFVMGFFSAILACVLLLMGIQWLQIIDPSFISYMPMRNICIMVGCVGLFGPLFTLLCTYFSVTRMLHVRESDLY